MDGSNLPQAFPNYLICLHFIRTSMVLWQSETWLSCVAVAGGLRPHPVLHGSTKNNETAEKQWQQKFHPQCWLL